VSPISIVVPARNEASNISATLAPLQAWRQRGHEVVVVDGGSVDATASLARPLCDRLLRTAPGRATQMNAGAAAASGSLLVFLHADSVLPLDAEAKLSLLSRGDNDYWGRFDVRLDAPAAIYRLIETSMNWRSRLTGIATGDQAIFVSRSLFEKVDGYPRIALMEDVALSATLRRRRRPICLTMCVKTSARRWQRDGVATTVLKMWCLRTAFSLGVSPTRLRAIYDRREALEP
jgi:rSAM/selenodomain-associated transferase 2